MLAFLFTFLGFVFANPMTVRIESNSMNSYNKELTEKLITYLKDFKMIRTITSQPIHDRHEEIVSWTLLPSSFRNKEFESSFRTALCETLDASSIKGNLLYDKNEKKCFVSFDISNQVLESWLIATLEKLSIGNNIDTLITSCASPQSVRMSRLSGTIRNIGCGFCPITVR